MWGTNITSHTFRLFQVLSRYSSSSSAPSPATSEKQLEKILQRNFPTATQISVNDVSGGCGAMYEIYIENPDFKGLSVVKQHRSVYDALKEQIKYIHALNLVTKVPS